MRYPVKKDLWISVVLLLVSVASFSAALASVAASAWKPEPGLWPAAFVFGSIGGLVLWMLLGSSCEITETHLYLSLGPLSWRLSLETIAEAHATSRLFDKDLGWGLALSHDRLRIKCRDRWMPFWISPESKPEFIAELQRAVPGLKVTSD